jgi:glycosyltransferase involved in cell wall biosynthesis
VSSDPVRVLHISVVHRPDDPRIFERECRSLAAAGYDVTYLAPGAAGERDGVTLPGLPERPRAERWRNARAVVATVRRLRPDVVHVHDPELLTLLPALKAFGPLAVYDMHEYLAKAVRTKHYVPAPVRAPLGATVGVAERTLAACADGVVVVVEDQYAVLGRRPALRTLLPTSPRVARFAGAPQAAVAGGDGRLRLIHIGTLAEARGVSLMLDVMREVGGRAQLTLGGWFPDAEYERRIRAQVAELSDCVTLLGRVPPAEVPDHLASAHVVWSPWPAGVYEHRRLSTNKVFEGLAVGLAALVSDLPGPGEVVRAERCGLVVPPTVAGHAAGVLELAAHRETAAEMGRRGREAVRARYSWETIEGRLLDFYATLLAARRPAAP